MEAVFSEFHRAYLLRGELFSLGVHHDTASDCRFTPECTPPTVPKWPHPRPEGSAQRGGQRPKLHLHCSYELPAYHGVLPSTQVLWEGAGLGWGTPVRGGLRGSESKQGAQAGEQTQGTVWRQGLYSVSELLLEY